MICAARQRDAYDEAVDYLSEHPKEIFKAWYPSAPRHGCLFRYAEADNSHRLGTGCLTMIRYGGFIAETEELTARIRADERIPDDDRITPDHLPVFAEWQRELDRVLGRTPPAMEEYDPGPPDLPRDADA